MKDHSRRAAPLILTLLTTAALTIAPVRPIQLSQFGPSLLPLTTEAAVAAATPQRSSRSSVQQFSSKLVKFWRVCRAIHPIF